MSISRPQGLLTLFSQVLFGVWGPIIVSVVNLLTIVLVLIYDVSFPATYFISCPEIPILDNFWGAPLAFGVLLHDK